ncbi:hypothetical protein GOP47_0016610 [Adiantum capillus-veneris]|uniref:Cystinosin homolog n=1 Tax=Adiantum capillus-veneris TaxID=13818 RepID=A0A9D4UI50_ADICA|nr:hypothetical protein GOP47_0016610 [Adiantum capillus-veneris]
MKVMASREQTGGTLVGTTDCDTEENSIHDPSTLLPPHLNRPPFPSHQKHWLLLHQAPVEWHSTYLHVLYEALGWLAFAAWSFSFHPQVILNFKRKSVVGLNFDYLLLNLTKQISYFTYNICMYFIPAVQRQYHERYGYSELIPVGPSDVAYSIHGVLFTSITAYQALVYEKGSQKVSMITVGISCGAWFAAGLCTVIAWPKGQWIWLVSRFNTIQSAITFIKYIPQAWMNHKRKSTDGYSIENIILDLFGSSTNLVQMGVQSFDQGSYVNFIGNMGKLLFCAVVLVYDGIFVVQHFCLYNLPEQPNYVITLLNEKQSKVATTDESDANSQYNDVKQLFCGRYFVSIAESVRSYPMGEGFDLYS